VTSEQTIVRGSPDVNQITTSHVGKQNHTLRMHYRRLTRLTNAFSKPLHSFKAAVALNFAYYSFCKIHLALRTTAAQVADIKQSIGTVFHCERFKEPMGTIMPDLFQQRSSAPVRDAFSPDAEAILVHGDTLETLRGLPAGCAKLVISSPPYNIGKEYEARKELDHYLRTLRPVLAELVRVLATRGSLCWQVGNYVEESEVFPLDTFFYPIFKDLGLQLRNRIIWHFEHGLHCSVRLSGRYETLLWFTKGEGYTFNLDAIRVASKYPGKTNFRPGPEYGKPSGNPLGKNPSDVWKLMVREWETGLWEIPNVKANHPEKTIHPCQFPIELVERCVLALTDEGDLVLDPFSGVASALLAALRHGRRAMGIEKEGKYVAEGKKRIAQLWEGTLPYRRLGKPVYQPTGRERVAQVPEGWLTLKDKKR
jgi:DNA modification methylase